MPAGSPANHDRLTALYSQFDLSEDCCVGATLPFSRRFRRSVTQRLSYLYDAVTLTNLASPAQGQFSGGVTAALAGSSSFGVYRSTSFKRATAPREISRSVQELTSFSSVELVTRITFSATPTWDPADVPRSATASQMVATAIPATMRSSTTFSQRCKQRRR